MLTKGKGQMRELGSPSDQETQAGHPWKYQELCLEMKQQTKCLGAAPTKHPFIMWTFHVWAEARPLERAELAKLKGYQGQRKCHFCGQEKQLKSRSSGWLPACRQLQEVKKAASSLQATSEVPSTPSLFVVLGGVNALFWHGL